MHTKLLASIIISLAALAAVAPANVLAQDVTLRGHTFYKDGQEWLPKGIKVEGFARPISPTLPKWANDSSKMTRDWWGLQEIKVIKDKFGGTVINLTVSQPGLDPQSSIYSTDYLAELLDAIKLARSQELVVILSMDAQAENGLPNLPCMPNDSTIRAWKTIEPSVKHDKGIMLEIFNEPCRADSPDGRKLWAQGMQSLIDSIRSDGADNILLLDGLGFAQHTNDLFPLVHDKLPNRLAMVVHPYVNSLEHVDPNNVEDYLRRQFGDTATKYPIIATEWNATETNSCVGDATPKIALTIVRYLQSQHIGLIGWAIDSEHGKMVKDHTNYEPTSYSAFKGCSKTTGESGAGTLIAAYPKN